MDICNRLINIFYLENEQIKIFYNNEAYQLNAEINYMQNLDENGMLLSKKRKEENSTKKIKNIMAF